MNNKITLTEKTLKALIGKTFSHLYNGEIIARGKIAGMVGPNALLLEVTDGEREWHEIQASTDIGYDRITNSGYQFSQDNPYREKLEG